MSRTVSLNRRVSDGKIADDDVEVVLVEVMHPDLAQSILVTSDPTVRLSNDPISYGTISTWRSGTGQPRSFLYISMNVVLPDEDEDGITGGQLAVELLDSQLGKTLVSTIVPATVSMAVVTASAPNFVEMQFNSLLLKSADIDSWVAVLSLDRDAREGLPYPTRLMSKDRFPGQFG